MSKGTAALLASLVTIIFLNGSTFASDGTESGYSATVSDEFTKNYNCFKTVAVSGYEIKDNIDLSCWMPSFVEATQDHLVVGYFIFSDSPNELVVINNGNCEKKTYNAGTLTSSSPMSSSDCEGVKNRMREVTVTTWDSWNEQQQANLSAPANLPQPGSESSASSETEISPEPTSESGTIPVSEDVSQPAPESLDSPVTENSAESETVPEPEISTEPETLEEPASESGTEPVSEDVPTPDPEDLNPPVTDDTPSDEDTQED